MKKFASVIFAILFCFGSVPLFAGMSVIRTDYFDIIYPDESAETAQAIAAAADGFADDICFLFDTSMKERIPVYINPDQKNLNAYFTSYLYNRIVVYDALPVDGALSGSRDIMLKVFYHELVHLVSLNVRTPFWQAMSELFGDCISINDAITMPLSFVEGATVSLESRDGEGRLNDPLVLHVLRQAKIDNAFLSFKDSAGARDVYPAKRLSYYYGGAFSAWLQNVYGMDKYAELWRRGGGFNPFLSWTWTRFRQVYGIAIDAAWLRFRDSITVPSDLRIKGNPVSGVKDGILSSLSSGPAGLVWLDANEGKVFFRDNAGIIHAIFDAGPELTRLSLSDDGSLLLVSSFSLAERATRENVRVFDMKRFRFTGESYDNLRDAAFAGGNDSVCGIETEGQRSSLVVFSRSVAGTADSGPTVASCSTAQRTRLAVAGAGQTWEVLFSPVFVRDGLLAFIGSNGQRRDIALVDTANGKLSALSFPDNTGFIRFLDASDTPSGRALSFCWATKNDLYRYGLYFPSTGEFALQQENISGGVFFPVIDTTGKGLYYIASFSASDRLMHVDLGETASLRGVVPTQPVSGAAEPRSPAVVAAKSTDPYEPLPWFRNGVFFPFIGTMPRKDGSSVLSPSFTYLTEDPTESVQLYASAAVFCDPLFVDGSVNALFRTDAARINLLSSDQVMPSLSVYDPYRQVTSALTVSRTDYRDASWKKLDSVFTASAHWYAPDIDRQTSVYDGSFDAGSLGGDAELVYSELHERSVPGRIFFPVTNTGFSVSADGFCGIVRPDNTETNLVQGKLTFLAPFFPLSLTLCAASADGLYFTPDATRYTASCAREYVWDETRYYPLFPEYEGTEYENEQTDLLVAAIAELKPFQLEIQKGIPLVPLYANRLMLVTGYRAAVFGITGSSRTCLDSLYVKGSFEASAVIGVLTNVLLSADVEYAYPLRAGTRFVFFTFGAKIPI